MSMPCPSFHEAENSFGPQVAQCVRPFDFTLLFEESILVILPTTVFAVLAAVRISQLAQRKAVAGANLHQWLKLATLFVVASLQVVLLVLWAKQYRRSRTTLAGSVLSLLATLVAAGLSFLSHQRVYSSSLLLDSYLFFSILTDIPRTRTLFMLAYPTTITATFCAAIGFKIAALFLEETRKSTAIHPEAGECASEETAGVISRALFLWINKLILRGYSTNLMVETLPRIDRKLQSVCVWETVGREWETASKDNNHALLAHVCKKLAGPLMAPAVPNVFLVALQLVEPQLINRTMAYLDTSKTGDAQDRDLGYAFIAGYGFVYIAVAIVTAWGQHAAYRSAAMIRACLVTLIYQHTTRVSISGLDDASAVTLMSADVERIVIGVAKFHETWTFFVQIAVALWLLERQVGVTFIVPLVLFLVSGGLVGYVSGLIGQAQGNWMKAMEKRIGFTSTVLGSMKGIKMSGLTGKAASTIQNFRLAEISAAGLYRLLICVVLFISYCPNSLSPAIMFAAYATLARHKHKIVDYSTIFTSLSLLSIITLPLAQLFTNVPAIVSAVGCFQRIQAFLLAPAREDKRVVLDEQGLPGETAVRIENGSFGWPERSGEKDQADNGKTDEKKTRDGGPCLANINASIPAGRLTLVLGPVASGKSTLLKAILGETGLARGSVLMASPRNVAFCDQTPWLSNETLQRNITAFSHLDPDWYAAVVDACALRADLDAIPDGDQCIVGSKGITLSGGQKQRVAMARAVYAKARFAIFDDVFSGLDTATQNHVFQHVFGPSGLLRSQGTTVVLATHAVYLLPSADHVIVLSSGTVAAQGPPAAVQTQAGFLHGLGTDGGSASSSSRTTAAEKDRPAENHAAVPEQPPRSLVPPKAGDVAVDDRTRRLGDISVYKYYFQTIGLINSLLFFFFQVSWLTMLKFPEIWLKWWGEANLNHPGQKDGLYLGVYALFQVLGLAALGCLTFHLFMVIVAQSGAKLHRIILQTALGAPMSFYSTTDIGSIVNRFSQDIQIIDSELPLAFLNLFANAIICVAQAVMILPASWYLIATYPFLVGVLYVVQRFYLRTSRQLRFLDLETKTPLYSQFLETLDGLATIRAFGWEAELGALVQARLDASQTPFYLLFSLQRWLNLVLDLVAAGMAITLVSVAVGLRGSVSVGFAGVALYNIMGLSGSMKTAVSVWTMLETAIGAVARIKSFAETTACEDRPEESGTAPDNWPWQGAVTIRGLKASYRPGLPPVLSDISLDVGPGEKVAICGRSGSGKSSLVSALFRMIDIDAGSIAIDGMDLATLPRHVIRERLNAIPQEPTFLSGSVRLNCDPWAKRSDDDIIQALQAVTLWPCMEAKGGGLDQPVTQDSFSHGQRQLFCLARALLARSSIVVMDEATSSVDHETDRIIQQVIRMQFKAATVLSIAHRVETVLDYDRIVVLDKGRIVQDGPPAELLSRAGAFKTLYEMYGHEAQEDKKSE